MMAHPALAIQDRVWQSLWQWHKTEKKENKKEQKQQQQKNWNNGVKDKHKMS